MVFIETPIFTEDVEDLLTRCGVRGATASSRKGVQDDLTEAQKVALRLINDGWR